MRMAMVCLFLAVGCASRPPLVCPARGGPAWRELTSPHFRLRSDKQVQTARALLVDLERTYSVFERYAHLMLPTRRPPPSGRIDVLLFERAEDFAALLRTDPRVNGVFIPGSRFDVPPLLIVDGDLETRTREVLQHELTHRFVRHYLPNAPVWLHEGLADYQSTVQIEDGRVRFGYAPLRHLLSARRENRYRTSYEIGRTLPSIVELIGADARTFRHPGRVETFYTGAWALVSLLESSTAYRPRLAAFLRALGDGARPDVAFGRAFGDLPRGELDQAYRAQVFTDTPTSYWDARYSPPVVATSAARVVDDAEVHLAWAAARPQVTGHFDAIATDLAEARRGQPDAPEPRYQAARLAFARGSSDVAEAELRSLAETHPAEERYAATLAEVVLDIEGRRPPSLKRRERLVETAERLEATARSPAALAQLAELRLSLGDQERAASFAMRAVEQAPDCFECLDTLARVAFADGAAADALEIERVAAALAPEGRRSERVQRDLERYARAAAEAGPRAP